MNKWFDKVDYFNRIYHQKVYVEELLANPEKFTEYGMTATDMRLMTLYARDYLNLKQQQRKDWLKQWLTDNCSAYNEVRWLYRVRRAIAVTKDGDQKLKEFEPPVIKQVEYDYIKSLGLDTYQERLLMMILVIYRFGVTKCGHESNGYYIAHWIFNPTDLETYYKVPKVRQRVWNMYGELERMGLLGYTDARDGQIIAPFIGNIDYSKEKPSDKSLTIWNIENAYLVYDYFENEKSVGYCKHCNDIFKQNKTGRRRETCKRCLPKHNQEQEDRLRVCIDCGEIFERKPHDVESVRCEACAIKHKKELKKAENARGYQRRKERALAENEQN